MYKGAGSSFTDSKLRNGADYRYVLAATDQAGLVWKVSVKAEPRALTQPLQGQKVKKPPLLPLEALLQAAGATTNRETKEIFSKPAALGLIDQIATVSDAVVEALAD